MPCPKEGEADGGRDQVQQLTGPFLKISTVLSFFEGCLAVLMMCCMFFLGSRLLSQGLDGFLFDE